MLKCAATLLLAAVLTACSTNSTSTQSPPPQAAPTLTVTASPTTVTSGTAATLTWSSTNATSVSFDNGMGAVALSGTAMATPTATTTFHGTATGPGGTAQGSVTVTVTASGPAPTVTLSASPSTVNPGQSSTLSWSATNATSLTIDQGVGSVTAPSGSTTVLPSATTMYTITASNGASTATASATVSVNSGTSQLKGIFTYKNDNSRTGQNLNEASLTPANVNMSQFGKKFTFNVDGYVYAQPLYVQGVTMAAGGTYNAIYVATEHDGVFAFDADGDVTTPLWQVNFTNPAAGITTVPTGDVSSTIYPEIGITSTPVIDPSSGTIYVEASTKENGAYFHRLHALDLTSGAEKFGGPVVISGSVPGTGTGNDGAGNVPFQPKIQLQRSALLLVNGNIYIAFASHGDAGEFHGWIFAYNAANLTQTGILNLTPNGQDGGIWQGGGGLAADSAGSIYGMTANGSQDPSSDYGDSFLRLTLGSGGFTVNDYFSPFNQQFLSEWDIDVGSGGPLLLPDQPGNYPHLITGAGKSGTIFLLDRDNLGGYSTSVDNVVQEIANALGTGTGDSDHNFCTPSYWQGRVYYFGSVDVGKAFTLSGGLLSTTPESESSLNYGFPGATPVISANGGSNGILWALERNGNELHAYDATNLANELYNSGQAGARDSLGTVVRFTIPMVANGRVYVGTKSTVVVYGLL